MIFGEDGWSEDGWSEDGWSEDGWSEDDFCWSEDGWSEDDFCFFLQVLLRGSFNFDHFTRNDPIQLACKTVVTLLRTILKV